MSYDLFFCWDRHERIDLGSVCAWAEAFACFVRKDNQLWYQNQDTGVYFSLDHAREPAGNVEGPEIPEGCFDVGLSFNLNFNRPSFFGYEAMPIVEDLSARFGLFAFDPQARDSEHLLLREVNGDVLLESWLESNYRAILALSEHGAERLPRMASSKSLYRWNYSKSRKNLEAKCGDQIFVPTIFARNPAIQ